MKSPLRVQVFREKLPDIPLPPEPVVTRWGTWLEAACYYADHFESFKNVVLEFPDSASEAVRECQTVLNDLTVEQNLAFIKANYSFVSHAIKKLETKGLALTDSLQIIDEFKTNTARVQGSVGDIVRKK